MTISRHVLILLVAATSAVSTVLTQDGSVPLLARPQAAVPDGIASVFAPASLPLEHGVEANVLFSLSETLLDGATGKTVRVAMLDTDCGLARVELSRNHVHTSVDASTDTPLRTNLGALDTQVAFLRAAECLGAVSATGEVTVTPAQQPALIPSYTVSVAPVAGETWASVTNALDLVISVELTDG